MKTRNGFVSNSSSSSYLLFIPEWDTDGQNLKNRILSMINYNKNLGRSTGVITDVKLWLDTLNDIFDDEEEREYHGFEKILRVIMEEHANEKQHFILIRESDEDDGLSEYNISLEEIYPYLVYQFEYH